MTRTITVKDIHTLAAALIGDTNNLEYVRGIVELLADIDRATDTDWLSIEPGPDRDWLTARHNPTERNEP